MSSTPHTPQSTRCPSAEILPTLQLQAVAFLQREIDAINLELEQTGNRILEKSRIDYLQQRKQWYMNKLEESLDEISPTIDSSSSSDDGDLDDDETSSCSTKSDKKHEKSIPNQPYCNTNFCQYEPIVQSEAPISEPQKRYISLYDTPKHNSKRNSQKPLSESPDDPKDYDEDWWHDDFGDDRSEYSEDDAVINDINQNYDRYSSTIKCKQNYEIYDEIDTDIEDEEVVYGDYHGDTDNSSTTILSNQKNFIKHRRFDGTFTEKCFRKLNLYYYPINDAAIIKSIVKNHNYYLNMMIIEYNTPGLVQNQACLDITHQHLPFDSFGHLGHTCVVNEPKKNDQNFQSSLIRNALNNRNLIACIIIIDSIFQHFGIIQSEIIDDFLWAQQHFCGEQTFATSSLSSLSTSVNFIGKPKPLSDIFSRYERLHDGMANNQQYSTKQKQKLLKIFHSVILSIHSKCQVKFE